MVGLIYKLSGGGLNYYGSTKNTLTRRFNEHKRDYKKYLEGKMCYITSFEIIDKGNYKIEVVEEVEDLGKLTEREQYYISNFECVNKYASFRTKEEAKLVKKITRKIASQTEHYKLRKKKDDQKYREKNAEKIAKRTKLYYEKNIEKIKAYQNEKLECTNCQKLINRTSLKRHQKSAKCLKIKNNNI